MARKFGTPIDMLLNAIQNVALQALAGAPGSPGPYQVYYDTTLNQIGIYDNDSTTWLYFSTGVDVVDADATHKGILELTNDLGGSATAPTVVGLHLSGDTSIGHKLTNVTDPASAQDAATQNYVLTRHIGDLTAPNADFSMNSHKITSVTDPTGAQDAATKNYVDNTIHGLSPKNSVDLVTTAALSPGNTLSGGVLTATGVGTLTVDSVLTTVGMRILVNNEAAPAKNGIYTVTTAGAAGTAYVLTRATDANTWAELVGAYLGVTAEGSTLKDTVWVATISPGGTIDTTTVGFSQIQSGVAVVADETFLHKSSNTIGPLSNADMAAPANGATATPTKGAGRMVKSAFTGNGALTTWTINHALSTRIVNVSIQQDSAGNPAAPIELDWAPSDANNVVVTFVSAPANATTYYATVIG